VREGVRGRARVRARHRKEEEEDEASRHREKAASKGKDDEQGVAGVLVLSFSSFCGWADMSVASAFPSRRQERGRVGWQ